MTMARSQLAAARAGEAEMEPHWVESPMVILADDRTKRPPVAVQPIDIDRRSKPLSSHETWNRELGEMIDPPTTS